MSIGPTPVPYKGRRISVREAILLFVLLLMAAMAVIPFIARGKSTASGIIAMNNLVQWGIGLNLYLNDNNNRLPSVGPAQPDAELADVWYNALPPYLSQVPWSKLVAPAFNRDDTSALIWNDPVMTKKFGKMKDVFIFPYGMNRYLQPDPAQSSYEVFDLQNPQSVVFLGEAASTDPGLLPAAVSYRHSRKPQSSSSQGHVLFVDGHAATVEREVLSAEPVMDKDAKLAEVSWLPFPGAPMPVSQ